MFNLGKFESKLGRVSVKIFAPSVCMLFNKFQWKKTRDLKSSQRICFSVGQAIEETRVHKYSTDPFNVKTPVFES
jgi:hypothetical protein